MMDVGWGEMALLAVVALLIFGPEKLPKAAADAGRMVRRLREMASSAQKDLSGDLDIDGIKNDLRSVADLHPKRIISSAMSDSPTSTPAPRPSAATTSDPLTGHASVEQPRPASPAPAQPPAQPGPRIDPDAT